MTKIENGYYYVRNTASGKLIGRLLAEDRSLLPKRVANLPDNYLGQTRFLFERTSENEYNITINQGRVVAINGHLFAASLPEPSPEQRWKLIEDERSGESNHFVIFDPRQGSLKAWKDSDPEDFVQIEVGPLPVGKSYPPYYPAEGVWVLEKADY